MSKLDDTAQKVLRFIRAHETIMFSDLCGLVVNEDNPGLFTTADTNPVEVTGQALRVLHDSDLIVTHDPRLVSKHAYIVKPGSYFTLTTAGINLVAECTILDSPSSSNKLAAPTKTQRPSNQSAIQVSQIGFEAYFAKSKVRDRAKQAEFRQQLLERDKRCFVTGCDVPDALEAAHIKPYAHEGTFEESNGILLRADVHALFDRGFFCLVLTRGKFQMVAASTLEETDYGKYKTSNSVSITDKLIDEIHVQWRYKETLKLSHKH